MKLFLLSSLAFFTWASVSHAVSQDVSVTKETHGKNCDSPDSFEVALKNTGPNTIDIQVQILSDKGWQVYTNTDFKPGATVSYFVCHYKNDYKIFERPAGSKDRFPKAGGILPTTPASPTSASSTPSPVAPSTTAGASTSKPSKSGSQVGDDYWTGQATGGPSQPRTTSSGSVGSNSKLPGGTIRTPDGPTNGSIRPKDKPATTNTRVADDYWTGQATDAPAQANRTTSGSGNTGSKLSGGTIRTTEGPANGSVPSKTKPSAATSQVDDSYWGGEGSGKASPTRTSSPPTGQSEPQSVGSTNDRSVKPPAATIQPRATPAAPRMTDHGAAEAREEAIAASRRRQMAQQEEDEELNARIAAKRAEEARFAQQLQTLSRGTFTPPPVPSAPPVTTRPARPASTSTSESSSSSSSPTYSKPLLTRSAPDESAERLRAQQQAAAAAHEAQQRQEAARVRQAMENERLTREANERRAAARPRSTGNSVER